MDNKGKFRLGTVFIGNINGTKMAVLKIQEESASGCRKNIAVIKDILTGRTFTYGLRALEKCSVTILEEKKEAEAALKEMSVGLCEKLN